MHRFVGFLGLLVILSIAFALSSKRRAIRIKTVLLGLTMQFALAINRTGKFTVELTATDQLSKQSAKVSFPLTVTKAK